MDIAVEITKRKLPVLKPFLTAAITLLVTLAALTACSDPAPTRAPTTAAVRTIAPSPMAAVPESTETQQTIPTATQGPGDATTALPANTPVPEATSEPTPTRAQATTQSPTQETQETPSVAPTTTTGPDGGSQENRAVRQRSNEAVQQFADAEPSSTWRLVRVPGWPSQPEFYLHLPPGWAWKEFQGIDSYVGEVKGDGIQLIFDYGGFSWTLDPKDDPEHIYAVALEEIGGFEAKLLISLNDRAGSTGVYFNIPASQILGYKDRGYISLNLVGEGLTQEEQHTAISVFRGIRFLGQ